MKITFYFVCAVAVQQLSTNFCMAQTLALKPAPATVTIDGDVKEWGDNLPYSNAKAKISYAIANDKDNLYLVIKTNDATEQRDILGSGITFSINTNGKKKAANSITFPTKTDDDQTVIVTMDAELIQTKVDQSKSQKIRPIGFKDIADAELATSNTYGIQTAIGYADGWLIYEEAIPMTLFTRADAAKEWDFNIKINALQKTGKPELPGTRTANSFSITKTESELYNKYETSVITTLSPAIDFWGKFTLAKQ